VPPVARQRDGPAVLAMCPSGCARARADRHGGGSPDAHAHLRGAAGGAGRCGARVTTRTPRRGRMSVRTPPSGGGAIDASGSRGTPRGGRCQGSRPRTHAARLRSRGSRPAFGRTVRGNASRNGKPRRAATPTHRKRWSGGTDSPAEQGPEVERRTPLVVGAVNGEGARACGDAGSGCRGGESSGGQRTGEEVWRAGGTASEVTAKPGEPHDRLQAATGPQAKGGANRRGGEKPRGRNMSDVWQRRAEADEVGRPTTKRTRTRPR
jgi:hypothetical protein